MPEPMTDPIIRKTKSRKRRVRMSSAMGYVEEDESRHHRLLLIWQQWFGLSSGGVQGSPEVSRPRRPALIGTRPLVHQRPPCISPVTSVMPFGAQRHRKREFCC